MAHGKIRVNTLTYDTGSGDVDVAVSAIPDAAALAAKADLANPTFTGTPAAPTATAGTTTTQLATTAFVDAEIQNQTGQTIQAFDADTAKTDVNQTFTSGQRGEVTVLQIVNGVLDPNFNDSNNFSIELNANVTSVNFQNAVAGQSGSIFISQPASGGPYTVGGWNSAFKFSGGAAPTITATNSKTDRVDYVIKSSTEIQVVWTGNY